MSDRVTLQGALEELASNPEQQQAVQMRQHCVVLAGPGSGKTKTLATAIARVLVEDVADPRGVACITYNNECAIELESRLARFGIAADERTFIGTVHSFALTQVIAPYARCIPGLLPSEIRVATLVETRAAIDVAYQEVFGDGGNPLRQWRFAEVKRRRQVDRTLPAWRGQNGEQADFIEAYEAELRRQGLIDFDDMPLIAYRIVRDHPWIREALRARYPVLFVDEYQDLGHALHELVLLLCFEGGIRLFSVGDSDQSIYGFTGANPDLLQALSERSDVQAIRLRFNYRSGSKIISASLGALGEERNYRGVDGAPEGRISFYKVNGDLGEQAKFVAGTLVPQLLGQGFQPEQIAVLYRTAGLGDNVANALSARDIAYVRSDGNALVKRNSKLARFIEECGKWVTGGWQLAQPPYGRLLGLAVSLVFGGRASHEEEQRISRELMRFLSSSIDTREATNAWLKRMQTELLTPWARISRNAHQEWEVSADMVKRTDPGTGHDLSLQTFAGRADGTGRVVLSTLHSAKGREFDVVIMYGMNGGEFPNHYDLGDARALREARRLFYVGVTRAKRELCLVYQEKNHSPWLVELHNRSKDR